MTRILIVYRSRSGTTEDIAHLLADGLRGAGHTVDVASAIDKPQPDADFFIVGSSVFANNWNAEAITWLQRNAEVLAGRTALFNVCLTVVDPAKRDEALALNDKAASIVKPVASESFAGRYHPHRVSWWQRVFLRAIQKPPQDHLDPEAIARWATELDVMIRGGLLR